MTTKLTAKFTSIEQFLALLDGVQPDGTDRWKALCPTHADNDPSLSITLKDGNVILLKCFGGCANTDITKTLGLKMSHLWLDNGTKPEKGRWRKGTGPKEQTAAYTYVDEKGKRLYRKLRWEPKTFTFERAEGVAGWVGGRECMKGVRRVLYDLPKVLAADTVFWCEGEKDAINLAGKTGVVATTGDEGAPMDTKKWKPAYGTALQGKHVVLVPDNDRAGIRHALFIAGKLDGIAASVKAMVLPTGTKDISDWFTEHDADEWPELLATARDYTPELVTELTAMYGEPMDAAEARDTGNDGHDPQADTDDEDYEGITNTDVGNAARLCQRHGHILRYVYEANKWLCWNGRHWEWDLGAKINHYATLTVKNIYREAANAGTPGKSRDLAKHAIASEGNARILAMINRAESYPGIPVRMVDLDTQDWLITCLNGTVDLRTGELLGHDPNHLITCTLDVDYDPAAKCPRWLTFLDRVCNNDHELIDYLQKCVGYSLTGSVAHEVVYFIYGEGQNGKSTFLSTIRKLLGPYGWRINPDMFMTRSSGGGPKESLANLKGKRFVVGSEVEEGKRFAMSLIKSTTGAETIQADRKYEHEIEYQPTHKLWLFGNYRPEVRDTTVAAWRRIKLIPFEVKIPDSEKDLDLKFKLQAELPGILAWAVKGCLAYQREGIADPKVVTLATERYRKEQDVFAAYVDECCVVNKAESVVKAAFRASLKAWCVSNNLDPFTTHQVTRLMADMGISEGSDGKHRLWKGIRLRTDNDPIPMAEAAPEPPVDDTDITDKIATSEHERIDKISALSDKKHTRGNLQENFSENAKITSVLSNPGDFTCGNCRSRRYWVREDGGKCTKICAVCRPKAGARVFVDDSI